MKFAPIVPIEYLDLIEGCDYHLILPHLLEHSDYATAYAKAEGFKILDNGEAEGMQGDPELLFKHASDVGAQEIVVPDVLFNWRETVRAMHDFALLAKFHPKFNYMAVVQGNDIEELDMCFGELLRQSWINRMAFPRAWHNIHRAQRALYAERMASALWSEGKSVHCLGGYHGWIMEPTLLASIPEPFNPVMGIDTSLPAVAALQEVNLAVPESRKQLEPRQGEFFETPYDEGCHELMKHNIQVYRSWCS